MDRAELLECMREASKALVEFHRLLLEHSREANGQVIEACEHFEYAIRLLEASKTCTYMRLAE